MAVSLLFISQFQTPSLHAYLDFATQDTNCFAFSGASELVEGVLGKTSVKSLVPLKEFPNALPWKSNDIYLSQV